MIFPSDKPALAVNMEDIPDACSYERAHSVSSISVRNALAQLHLSFSFVNLSATK